MTTEAGIKREDQMCIANNSHITGITRSNNDRKKMLNAPSNVTIYILQWY